MEMDVSAGPRQTCSQLLFVFDVGGVLIGLDRGARETLLGASTHLTPDAATRLSHADMQFRVGLVSEKEYVALACEIRAIEADAFYQAEDAFLIAGDPAMAELVENLSKSHRTVAFSNTHIIHWRRVERDLIAADAFHALYLSHEMGLEKPDLVSYEAVAAREGFAPENIVFVDDTLANVEAARSAGWGHCIHHRSSADTAAAIAVILA